MLPSGLPEQVADPEPLARFLTSDGQFNRGMAKAPAFMPGPADGATSVFRQSTVPPEALWALADRELEPQRKARGVAVLTAAQVRSAQLEVMASEPPARHANIQGWPEVAGDTDLTRARRREQALLLASVAQLVLR